ncbi:MAG: UDP-4-amino-4,6-dideoxy-N-acetyl-beta-L-altrosamine transaminase [Bacteroides sp. SM23_62]|nr:MAG: UDP-4-amino-4,6-dideoxy-N-acetyl-beta-L-altrosamine transaminase [Bacteroides sp. SM23_62]
MERIPYGRQHITDEDIQEVVKVLKADYLTQGPKIAEFEKAFADYIGVNYAVAVANGTAALHLSALTLGINRNSRVITTPITFIASANCVIYCGGQIDFVDIDEHTFLLDLDKLEEKLALKPPGYYQGVIPVDFAGLPLNTEYLYNLAKKYNFWILEDSCHAPGGYFNNSNSEKVFCGNGKYADLSIFSFHPVKHIATGEGGMITTNNEKFYNKLQLYRIHGVTKQPELMEENHGGWYYEMQELGFNYRLTEISGALGISQLKNADKRLERRIQIAEKYDRAFKDTSIITQHSPKHFANAYHLYIILVNNRLELYNELRKYNIHTQVHYIPVHLQPFYKKLGWKAGDFPVAESYYNRCLSLPMYPSLSDEEQQYVIDKTLQIVK